MPSKKIAQKETLVHSHLSLSLPSLNETRGIGTQKIVYWPPPPPGKRDKLHFPRSELINTLWPFRFKSTTTILQDIENFHNVRLQEMLQIVWKQKHKSEHGTWDNPSPIRICPLFDELKKGYFFYPPFPCMDQCILLSNFFFWRYPAEYSPLYISFMVGGITNQSINLKLMMVLGLKC